MTRIGIKWMVGYNFAESIAEPDNFSAFRAAVGELSQKLPQSDSKIATIQDVSIKGSQAIPEPGSPMFTKRFEVGLRFSYGAYPNQEYHYAKAKVAFYYAPKSVSNTIIEGFDLDGQKFEEQPGTVVRLVR